MKWALLPSSRAGIVRLGLCLALFVVVVACTRPDRAVRYLASDKREGDIVFQSLPHNDLTDAIEGITGSPWSHCGVLVQRDGKWFVAEAIGTVRCTPLTQWVMRGRGCVVESYRLVQPPVDLAERLRDGLQPLMGRMYDYRYAPGDDEIYCSELVHKVYEREMGVSLGRWQRLGDLNWKPHEAFIREMESGSLPLDREMVTPVSLTTSPLLERVYQ
jgi:hypothetical protein